MTAERKSFIVWGSFFLLMLAWGSSFILVKRALQGEFTAFEIASVRMVAAFSVLILPAFVHFKHIPKEKLHLVILSGLISMLFPAYLFATAQVYIKESSLISILNALTPAFTFIVGILAFRQPLQKMQALGLIIGFAGSALLIIINSKVNYRSIITPF